MILELPTWLAFSISVSFLQEEKRLSAARAVKRYIAVYFILNNLLFVILFSPPDLVGNQGGCGCIGIPGELGIRIRQALRKRSCRAQHRGGGNHKLTRHIVWVGGVHGA